ncbi:putative sulfate exporter family transporter, partial [bacterium]|nr:putative sulfate exporter family transporter [bacterium]
MEKISKSLMVLGGTVCLLPFVPSWAALLSGIVLALTVGNPFLAKTQKMTSQLLAIAIVGLGCGMNLQTVA